MSKYGNFGTKKGRAKGGLNSIKSHIENKTPFKTIKKYHFPNILKNWQSFLEFFLEMGIYQNIKQVLRQIQKRILTMPNLLKINGKTFQNNSHAKNSQKEKAVRVTMSSKMVVTLLNKLGMPIGNKIKKIYQFQIGLKVKLLTKRRLYEGYLILTVVFILTNTM